mmetsp:Transcript_22488/g.67440  ORF Transcript_22488/g.67440 Transcript_22488/m.67440 type:complete len:257 (+) Transcript_22488:718-1488(+)
MRDVIFFSCTHFARYSLLPSASCHSYLMSSKPSSSVGIVKLPKDWLITDAVRSLLAPASTGRNHIFFSSSVSSTWGGPSSGFSSSISSSFFSSSFTSSFGCSSSSFSSLTSSASSALGSSFASSASFSAPSLAFFSASSLAFFSASFFLSSSSLFFFASSAAFFRASSAFRRISANCFCLFSTSFLRFSSSFLAFHSASDLTCFSCSLFSSCFCLYSSVGSPIRTVATFLKWGRSKRFRVSCLSAATRLDLTSMTT